MKRERERETTDRRSRSVADVEDFFSTVRSRLPEEPPSLFPGYHGRRSRPSSSDTKVVDPGSHKRRPWVVSQHRYEAKHSQTVSLRESRRNISLRHRGPALHVAGTYRSMRTGFSVTLADAPNAIYTRPSWWLWAVSGAGGAVPVLSKGEEGASVPRLPEASGEGGGRGGGGSRRRSRWRRISSARSARHSRRRCSIDPLGTRCAQSALWSSITTTSTSPPSGGSSLMTPTARTRSGWGGRRIPFWGTKAASPPRSSPRRTASRHYSRWPARKPMIPIAPSSRPSEPYRPWPTGSILFRALSARFLSGDGYADALDIVIFFMFSERKRSPIEALWSIGSPKILFELKKIERWKSWTRKSCFYQSGYWAEDGGVDYDLILRVHLAADGCPRVPRMGDTILIQ